MAAKFSMKFILCTWQVNFGIENSVWAHKIADGCINTLTFKPNGQVLEFDCELNYTFRSTFKLTKDTIIVTGKDDSHSEDHGKITSFWIVKYLIRNRSLLLIANKQFDHGKWKECKIRQSTRVNYLRIK